MTSVCAGSKCGKRDICKNAECHPYPCLVYDLSLTGNCTEENDYKESDISEDLSLRSDYTDELSTMNKIDNDEYYVMLFNSTRKRNRKESDIF